MLAQPWFLLLIGLLIVGLIWGIAYGRSRRDSGFKLVSNSEYLDALPAYQRWARRYRWLQLSLIVTLLASAIGATFAAARPISYEVHDDRIGTRDIVLCLDVSGSMLPFNEEIVDNFLTLLDGFSGERIALTVFNSTSRVVFPLTDDYTMIRSELEEVRGATQAALALENVTSSNATAQDWANLARWERFAAGTIDIEHASSLVPDGLATCALQFDDQATERSRSVILATDNEVFGDAIYSLDQAGKLVQSREASLFSLYAHDPRYGSAPGAEQEYRTVTAAVSGRFFPVEDPRAVDSILEEVRTQQIIDLDASPDLVTHDHIKWWVVLCAIAGIGFLAVTWRLEQ